MRRRHVAAGGKDQHHAGHPYGSQLTDHRLVVLNSVALQRLTRLVTRHVIAKYAVPPRVSQPGQGGVKSARAADPPLIGDVVDVVIGDVGDVDQQQWLCIGGELKDGAGDEGFDGMSLGVVPFAEGILSGAQE